MPDAAQRLYSFRGSGDDDSAKSCSDQSQGRVLVVAGPSSWGRTTGQILDPFVLGFDEGELVLPRDLAAQVRGSGAVQVVEAFAPGDPVVHVISVLSFPVVVSAELPAKCFGISRSLLPRSTVGDGQLVPLKES